MMHENHWASITGENDMYFHGWAGDSNCEGLGSHRKLMGVLFFCKYARRAPLILSKLSTFCFQIDKTYTHTCTFVYTLPYIHTHSCHKHACAPNPHVYLCAPMHAHLGARLLSLHWSPRLILPCAALSDWAPPPSCSLWEISSTPSNQFTSDSPTLASRWWQSGAI